MGAGAAVQRTDYSLGLLCHPLLRYEKSSLSKLNVGQSKMQTQHMKVYQFFLYKVHLLLCYNNSCRKTTTAFSGIRIRLQQQQQQNVNRAVARGGGRDHYPGTLVIGRSALSLIPTWNIFGY
ncbi:hypothetical protein F2P81_018888 [Scophthalmus maximus]|uniref:Uncharacterized protein n=1 Tax=Scophthalmus maximus TaxID=52904 RepID=A0A6A4S5V8_SCOMX|nr:hypothetical protein F2P81_018888 [Scophthalmus maximus]